LVKNSIQISKRKHSVSDGNFQGKFHTFIKPNQEHAVGKNTTTRPLAGIEPAAVVAFFATALSPG
jgi:hypothetical protein